MYRVLLVDDESIARVGLRTTFDWEANGFIVVGEASNGQKAMKWIENEEVDILITDIAMPVMDGLELTRRTRKLCPWVKVLLMSCHNDFEFVREGIRLGASDYLLKPTMETEDLKAILEGMKVQVSIEKERLQLYTKFNEQKASEGRHETEKSLNNWLAAENTLEVKPNTDESCHQRMVNEAIVYINEHYTEMLSLQDVANYVCISKNYFSELFKRETGLNFIDYVIQLRLKRAKNLLQSTRFKVYEVAEMSGFNDVKHFSKLFKRMVGSSPAEFQGARN